MASSSTTTSVNVPPVSIPTRRRAHRVPRSGNGGGGLRLQHVPVAAVEGQVALGQVVEPWRTDDPGLIVAIGSTPTGGGHPARLAGAPGQHLAGRSDDQRVAEVDVPAGVDADARGGHDVDVVVVGPGPGGQLPDVGGPQEGGRPHHHLGPQAGLDADQLGEVAVEADHAAHPAEVGADHQHVVARRDPGLLGGEQVGLAVDAQHLARRAG